VEGVQWQHCGRPTDAIQCTNILLITRWFGVIVQSYVSEVYSQACFRVSALRYVNMSDKSPQTNENAIAQQTQEKFEFYLLSLVFTLLALSVQTAKFEAVITADILELVGWLFLIISGCSGLSRMQWVPVIRTKLAQQQSFEDEIFNLKKLQLEGQTEVLVLKDNYKQPIPERIKNRQDAINLLAPHIKGLERKHYIKYYSHIYGFAIGVLCVACARAYSPVLAIYKSLGPCV